MSIWREMAEGLMTLEGITKIFHKKKQKKETKDKQ